MAISTKWAAVGSMLGVGFLFASAQAPARLPTPISPALSLSAKSPQEQGKRVFVHVKTSTTKRLESLRLTGRIRVARATTHLTPIRAVSVKAGTAHRFTMRQDDPDERRIVRKAMKRGKTPLVRIRCGFHPDAGKPIIRTIVLELVYRDGD